MTETERLAFEQFLEQILDRALEVLGRVPQARTAEQRHRSSSRSGHEVTDNRHLATENDPGRGSATTENP